MHVKYRYESIKLRMPKASTGNIIAIRMFSTYSPAEKLMASNQNGPLRCNSTVARKVIFT